MATAVVVKPIRVSDFEARLMGDEPTWTDQENLSPEALTARVLKAYHWYNYHCDAKAQRKFMESYFKANKDKRSDAVLAVEDFRYTITQVGAMARMILVGFKLDKVRKAKFNAKLDDLAALGAKFLKARKEAVKAKEKTRVVVSVQAATKAKAGEIIAEMEDELDKFILAGCKDAFSPFDWLKERDIKAIYAAHLITYYTPVRDEVAAAVAGKDDELKYAYRLFTKKQGKAFLTLLNTLLSDAATFGANKKKQAAPRKKKEKSVDKVVSKVKYQKEDADLKLASIRPENIVGAMELWTYNTKYHVIQHYVAIDRGGLSVKNSSIKNFSEKESTQRAIRKPETILPGLLAANGTRAVNKMYNDLATKTKMPNGRLNEFTILLRVFK